MKRASHSPPSDLSSPTRGHTAKKFRQAPPSPPNLSAKATAVPASIASPSRPTYNGKHHAAPTSERDLQATMQSARLDKRKMKKAAKSEAKLASQVPRFFYSNTEMSQRREPVAIGDIRDLVLHLNPRSIQKVVALMVPGLTHSMLDLPPPAEHSKAAQNPNLPIPIPAPDPKAAVKSQVPFVAETFMHACPTRAAGEATKMHSILSSFFTVPVSGEEKERRQKARISLERQNSSSQDPTPYLLTPEQMIENEYPVPSYMADVFTKPLGWVETPLRESGGLPKVYALDCEMCVTEDGRELTRVCVIDWGTDKVVYDELVMPEKPILDYLTRFSGITAEKLRGVQHDMLTLFASHDSTPVLLGHSLESDLRALKICHPRCIDTALIYHHPRGRPLKPGLAWLTRKWCGREIQTAGEGGHDPEEDARACAELLKLKITNGTSFGEFKTDHESILERLARAPGRRGRGITSAVCDYGNPGSWHGAKATTAVACRSDEEVANRVIETVPPHDFVFGRLISLSEALEWTTPKANALTPPPPPPPLEETARALNGHLARIYASLPPRTAFVLFSGHEDPRRMSVLNMRKSKFESEIRAGRRLEEIDRADWWSAQEGRQLEDAVELAKRGLLFLCLKEG
ncbi:hypothetical protein BKA62DRAFT_698831 [Auriculariales sp. MPI-PUGE-AT-0066]|nr:hypothetical protein BKA62DRAFT_698831 [Auriculariales sp. MPI-PUGE-AT-0066]